MSIMDKVKSMFSPKEDEIAKKIKDKENSEKLAKWKEKLNTAMAEHDTFRAAAAKWDELYCGTKDMSDISVTYMSEKADKTKVKEARQVVNITFQLIESQIDITIPTPRADALEVEDEPKIEMIEGMLTSIANSAELERINSENERIVKKNSLAIFKVQYDPSYKSHTFIGRIKTTNPHPCNIIPQPNINRIEDMDYMFQIENRTLDYICREYGEEFRAELEEETAEFGYLEVFSDTNTNSSNNKGQLSIVEAWYKDEDGDICLLTWCNEVILRDTPKFYYKRDETGNIMTTEVLTIDSVDPLTQQPIQQQIEVECYVPKRFPYVAWYNIPKEKSFIGLSDPHIIKDQQAGIKKMLSMEEEKQVMGTTKIFTRKNAGLKDKLTNATSQIIETDDPTADIKVVDLKTPDNALKDLYSIYVQAAKDSLGITEASQGRAESSALSGRALQLLAQNTQNRLSVKNFEKQRAFKELYNLYYDFLIAFYDDKIPFKIKGQNNETRYGYFDKSILVKQDSAGQFYYPEFDIYITADGGIPKDKQFVLQTAQEDFKIKALDPVEYWTIKETIGYPNASMILDMEKEKQQQAMAMQQQQQQMAMQQQGLQMQQAQQQLQNNQNPNDKLQAEINNLPDDLKNYLMNLSPDKQQEILQEYMQMQG